MSGTLNQSNYQTVWSDNFTQDSSLNSSLFPIQWGDSGEFSFNNGLTLTSDGNPAGFLTDDQGASDSTGYGLYSTTISVPSNNQAPGIAVTMWPASNQWPGPEIDLAEQLNGQAYMTVHWAGSDGSDQYQSYVLPNVDLTQPTTLAMDWEKGSLTFYVNGQEVTQYTAGGAVPIPADAADGGQNEAFGAEVSSSTGAQLTLYNMSYAQYTGGGSGSDPSTSSTSSSGSTATAAASTPDVPITVSSPGTVQESSPGAGATEQLNISAPGLSQVYAMVMNSQNVGEENWIPITLNNVGQASYDFTFQNSGDYVLVASSPNSNYDTGTSSPISLTDPSSTAGGGGAASSWIDVSNPGAVAAGASTPITFSDPGLSQVYALVMNPQNVAEENWQEVPLNSQGVGSASFAFQNNGDYVLAVSDPTTQADRGWSGPVSVS